MVILPNQKTKLWSQVNRGDVLGSLVGSFNLDLTTKPGKVRTTGMIRTTTEGTNTDMTTAPYGFRRYNGYIWAIAGTKVHKNTLNTDFPRSPFTVDAISGSPTDLLFGYSDMEVFNGRLYVAGYSATNASLYRCNGTAWTTVSSTIGNSAHYMTTYGNRLYFTTNQTSINSMSTAEAIATLGDQYTLQLGGGDTGQAITFIRAGSNKIWIGYAEGGTARKGSVYQWDGSSNQANKVYRMEASSPKACVIKDDIPYVMDSNGKLIAWNGGNFVEVARLPLDERNLSGSLSSTSGWIHPNGMSIVGGRIQILINNLLENNAGSIPENCPSGIWEYDPDIGLYHKHSFSYTAVGTTTITGWGQNRIAQAGALSEMRTNDTNAAANGRLLAGAKIYATQSTTDCGVFIDDTLDTTQKFAYLVTPEIQSEGVTDIMQKVYAVYRRLLNSGDKIILKYRITKQDPTEMTITWTSTTTFTTTDANMANYAVGDEVEITRGKGGGMCSHITAISLNAGTYTVTVDETHTGATSGTATARLQKWIKLGSVTDQVESFKEFPVGLTATWIQVKVCFLWTGANEFERLAIINEPQQKPV